MEEIKADKQNTLFLLHALPFRSRIFLNYLLIDNEILRLVFSTSGILYEIFSFVLGTGMVSSVAVALCNNFPFDYLLLSSVNISF